MKSRKRWCGAIRKARMLGVLACVGAAIGFQEAQAVTEADFVFVVDATGSMAGEIAAVQNGLSNFVTGLNAAQVDARFAVVLFGGAPELVQDFTNNGVTTASTFSQISVNGAVANFQNNHNVNPEAGLEAIRIVLGAASNNTLLRNNLGGAGGLVFRPGARKNIILVTDEDADSPFYGANRFNGQTGFGSGNGNFGDPPNPLTQGWQDEIDATATAAINNDAFINILMNASDVPSQAQYGDPNQDVSNANFLNFNPGATLTNLVNAGFGDSLEAQVIAAGLIGRSFNINDVNSPNFIDNFFAAKIEEVTRDVIPEPLTGALALMAIAASGMATRRRRVA